MQKNVQKPDKEIMQMQTEQTADPQQSVQTEQPARQEMTLEEGFARLEELMAKMESGEQTLEEMYHLYREGIEIVRICNAKIDTVEKNMLLMDADGNMSEFA